MTVTLQQADTIITSALMKAREGNFRPLTAVVLDHGGHAVALSTRTSYQFCGHALPTETPGVHLTWDCRAV